MRWNVQTHNVEKYSYQFDTNNTNHRVPLYPNESASSIDHGSFGKGLLSTMLVLPLWIFVTCGRQRPSHITHHLLRDRPWISPWIKSISKELDITFHMPASQSFSEWDMGQCVNIVVFIVIYGFCMSCKKYNNVSNLDTNCSCAHSSVNKQQNKPFMST